MPRRPRRHAALARPGCRRMSPSSWTATAAGPRRAACPRRSATRPAPRRCAAPSRPAIEQGVGWLTLFAFSSENWRRPAEEVRALTGLLRLYLRAEVATLAKEGIRLRVIGDRARFGAETMKEIERAETQTAGRHAAEPDRRPVLWRAGRDPRRRPRGRRGGAGRAGSTRPTGRGRASAAGCSPPTCRTPT